MKIYGLVFNIIGIDISFYPFINLSFCLLEFYLPGSGWDQRGINFSSSILGIRKHDGYYWEFDFLYCSLQYSADGDLTEDSNKKFFIKWPWKLM